MSPDRPGPVRQVAEVLPEEAWERIEPEDGDERKAGYVTVAHDIGQAVQMTPVPAPPDHPAREDSPERQLLIAKPTSRLVLPPVDFDPRRINP